MCVCVLSERNAQELSQELAAEKRRVAHSTRKLEQNRITCTELRESLALAQDTVRQLFFCYRRLDQCMCCVDARRKLRRVL